MKLLLVSGDGQILDSEDITRDELANLTPAGAYALLGDLQPGTEGA